MKKFLILMGILLIVFCGFVVYDNYFHIKIPRLDIEEEVIDINKLYVYGTHFNMEGNYNFDEEAELVLYDGEFIVYDLNYDVLEEDNDNKFNLSNLVNDGMYLDDIPMGEYYLFLRVKVNSEDEEKYKYYSLKNNTEYEDTVYYTMSNYNKKITINSEDSYPTMMINVEENKDDEIYDVVIDPGHGGRDGGSSKNGYKETDFTMDIATKLKEKLEGYGMRVKLTHEEGQLSSDEKLDDYGVHGRAVVSSEVKAKYLFSIHLNSSYYDYVSGLEVYTAKNINYDFAKLLVKNITSLTGLGYSNLKIDKIDDSIYSRNLTQNEIDSSIDDYNNKELIPYEITTNSNYYYMIRETGGIVTGAYVDDRNSEITGNTYVDSNVGTEAYLLELGYLSNNNDLDSMINNMDKYVEGIALSIKNLYDKK